MDPAAGATGVSRWRALGLALAGLALAACAAPTYSEARADWPPLKPGTGRIVFLGDNFGWYGLLEGVSWKPTLSIDGRVLDAGHDEDVYFATDQPVGKRVIAVDGLESLSVIVQEGTTKYVEMQRYSVVNDGFGTRATNYKLRLVQLTEAHAQPLLDRFDCLGFVR